ncbi:Nucleoporin autopeptidase family protein [Aphelenchoides avenae]|nr:Nucleoporin autopeptidase family protein [Aphelenchus avenae]
MFGGGSAFGSGGGSAFSSGTNQGSSLFGQQKPLFGTPTASTGTSLFGSQSNTGTMASSGGLFGQNKPSLFGSGQQSAFGTATPSTGMSLFGSGTAGAQGAPVGTTVKFDAPRAKDTMMKNNETRQIDTRHMCITAMREYEAKSLEELRVEDYLANRKSGTTGGTSLFGTQQAAPTFGATTGATGGGGLFGGLSQNKPSLFSSSGTTGFGGTTTMTQPSLFGGTATTQSSSLFGAKPATGGSIFGTQTSSAFGAPQTSSTGGGLFGASKPTFGGTGTSLFGGTTGSAFGTTTTATSAFSLGGATATTTTPSLFGSTGTTGGGFAGFGQQQQQQSAFGKPATSSAFGGFGGTQPTATPFGTTTSTGTGLFGNTAAKPSLFGAQTSTAPSLFGSTATSTAPSLFGSTGGAFGQQNQQQQSMFGAAQLQQGMSILTGYAFLPFILAPAMAQMAPAPAPIILGSNVDEVALRRAIIEAQLSTLPYGDSPLLKSTPLLEQKTGATESPTSMHRQMKFLAAASERVNGKDGPRLRSLPPIGSKVTNFTYKPLAECRSPKALQRTRDAAASNGTPTTPTTTTSTPTSKTSVTPSSTRTKFLDPSVIHKRPGEALRRSQREDADEESHFSDAVEHPDHSPFVDSFTSRDASQRDSSTADVTLNYSALSPPRDTSRTSESNRRTSASPRRVDTVTTAEVVAEADHPARIRLTRPEYYCDPPLEELAQAARHGVCHIDAGLTVGRLGYGSVFWRGPFDLRDVDLDEIVHFRHKEVTVYPDDEKKPPVGEGLNRPAEVSLERIWPVDRTTRELVKDPDTLARMNFREKLERICSKMDAVFKDYQPASGTWTFEVSHFSKYSFIEDDDEDQPSADQLRTLNMQRKTLSLVQRARPPLTERLANATAEVGLGGIGHVQQQTKRELIAYDDEEEMDDVSASILSLGGPVATKKPKFEDLLEESKYLLRTAPSSMVRKSEETRPEVEERTVVEAFKGINITEKSIFALAANPRRMEALFRRGCYVRFAKGSTLLFDAQAYSGTIGFSRVTAAPRLEEFFVKHLDSKGQLGEWPRFQRLPVLHWDPPSLLLRLIDSFVLEILQRLTAAKAEEIIARLCQALFVPFGKRQGFDQKTELLKWIRSYLATDSEHSVIERKGTLSSTFRVYKELVNGRTSDAEVEARRVGLYFLSMQIRAASKQPLPPPLRQPLARQTVKSKDAYERKVLTVLSGDVEDDDIQRLVSAVEGLNWLQALQVILGFWSRQSMGLDRCMDLLETLIRSGAVRGPKNA